MALILISLAWLSAIAAIALWNAPWWMGAAWVAALSPLAFRRGRSGQALAAACFVAALLGGFRFAAWHDRPEPSLAAEVGKELTLEGTVSGEPNPGLTTLRYRLDVDTVDGRPTDGAVLVYVSQYADYLPGDRLRVSGELQQPPPIEGFDYRAWLLQQGIVGTVSFPEVKRVSLGSGWSIPRLSAEARGALEDSLQRSLPEPEASLATGIAFGRDATLPDDLQQRFRDTGLAHLTAVSGSNVTLVTGVIFYLLTPLLGRRRALLPAAIVMLLYLLAAGLTWSVLRAGLMAAVFLGGIALGRPQAGLPALGLAMVLLTAAQPSAATDVGFQLSFAATAGIIAFAPWLRSWGERGLSRSRLGSVVPGAVLQVAAMSLAATVSTLPITWAVFGRVSLVGLLANLIAEPVFAVAFLLSLAAALAGLAWAPAGWAFALGAYYPLAFLDWLAATLARVPFAAVDLPRTDAQSAALAYILLAVPAWYAYRRLAPPVPDLRHDPRVRLVRRATLAGAFGCLAVAIIPLTLLPARGPGHLEVAVLDVGQGDAILVTTPGGHHVLVDGGPSGIQLARELGATLPHWQRNLDAIVLTHPQEDHIAGLPEALARFHVQHVYDTGRSNDIEAFDLYVRRANVHAVVAAGDVFTFDSVRFEVLWPPAGFSPDNLNDTSTVLMVTYGETRILLTGDLEAGAQRRLLAFTDVHADVLKVPHHGSRTSAPDFLQAVGAGAALISVGEDNRFGHPHQETLDALSYSHIYRTDEDGRIVVASSGHTVSIRTED